MRDGLIFFIVAAGVFFLVTRFFPPSEGGG